MSPEPDFVKYGKAPLCFCVPQKMLFLLPDCLAWPYACSVLTLAKSQGACELTYFLPIEMPASEIWYPSDVCVNELLPAISLRLCYFFLPSCLHTFPSSLLSSQTWQPYTQFQCVTSLIKSIIKGKRSLPILFNCSRKQSSTSFLSCGQYLIILDIFKKSRDGHHIFLWI